MAYGSFKPGAAAVDMIVALQLEVDTDAEDKALVSKLTAKAISDVSDQELAQLVEARRRLAIPMGARIGTCTPRPRRLGLFETDGSWDREGLVLGEGRTDNGTEIEKEEMDQFLEEDEME